MQKENRRTIHLQTIPEPTSLHPSLVKQRYLDSLILSQMQENLTDLKKQVKETREMLAEIEPGKTKYMISNVESRVADYMRKSHKNFKFVSQLCQTKQEEERRGEKLKSKEKIFDRKLLEKELIKSEKLMLSGKKKTANETSVLVREVHRGIGSCGGYDRACSNWKEKLVGNSYVGRKTCGYIGKSKIMGMKTSFL